MKHLYLSFSVLLFSLNSNAQAVIQASDINPIIGESFVSYKTNSVSVGPSGANVTWDLSAMVVSSTQSSIIESSNPSFEMTNSTTNIDGLSKIYSSNSVSGQEIYGDLEGSTLITYSNPLQMLAFPLCTTLNSSDTHNATFTILGTDFTRNGNSNISCNGWGTLITPEGTFTDVLRIRLEIDYTDYYAGGSLNYQAIAYAWYKAGIHKELATVVQITSPSGVSSYGQYLETSNLGLRELKNEAMSIYPNPATSEINFKLVDNKEIKLVEILNMNGKLEKEISSNMGNSVTLNVEDLSVGMYLLKVTTIDDESKVVKFLKQ